MYTKKIDNSYFANKSFLGFSGEIGDIKILMANLEEPKINMNKKVKSLIGKNSDYLKALGMPETILNMKLQSLSETDLKLIKLIKVILLKPQIIILNNIELGINDRITNRLTRFFKTINGAFNIKFMIISRNPIFISKVTKDILIMKNGIVKYQGNLLLAIKQNHIPKPEIIKYIDMANSKGAKLDYTLEDKELLKAVYRCLT